MTFLTFYDAYYRHADVEPSLLGRIWSWSRRTSRIVSRDVATAVFDLLTGNDHVVCDWSPLVIHDWVSRPCCCLAAVSSRFARVQLPVTLDFFFRRTELSAPDPTSCLTFESHSSVRCPDPTDSHGWLFFRIIAHASSRLSLTLVENAWLVPGR